MFRKQRLKEAKSIEMNAIMMDQSVHPAWFACEPGLQDFFQKYAIFCNANEILWS